MIDKYCEICGAPAETHHIVFRSECKPLENCKMNLIYLCYYHHRDHKAGAHHNKKFNLKLKLKFQNKLELLFDKEAFTREEITEILGIKDKDTYKLVKIIKQYKDGSYKREDIIRQAMGGKTIDEDS